MSFQKSKILFVFSLLVLPNIALAAGLVPCGGPNEPACELCHLFVMLNRILDFVFSTLVPFIAVAIVIYAGFTLLTSGGNPGKRAEALGMFKSLVIGLFLVYGSYAIINTLLSFSDFMEWKGLTEGWWEISGCPST